MDFILKKSGSIIGADKLATVAIRNLAPVAVVSGLQHSGVDFPEDEDVLALPVSRRHHLNRLRGIGDLGVTLIRSVRFLKR
jgi:hypothetical protein